MAERDWDFALEEFAEAMTILRRLAAEADEQQELGWLNTAHAARHMDMNVPAFESARDRGEFPGYVLENGRWRYRISELDALLTRKVIEVKV